MRYVVIELQTDAGGEVASLVTTHATREEAESKWHAVLSAAAVSALPAHACALLDAEGTPVDYRCYWHGGEA